MVSAFASQNSILMPLHQLLVFLLLFGSCSLWLIIAVGGSKNNETDRFSLLEFKKQIYDPYGSLSSWNDSIRFCNWVGITCGRRHQQQIISLNLQGKGLGGNISPFIGNLTFLRFLSIANNSFYGKIPQEISNMIRLREIYFDNNTLEGEIPTSLANCTHLREIWFPHNNLVGKIPFELFASLSELEIIAIDFNGLTGEIPASFGNMSSIQVISLAYNELEGSIPESFGHLTNLYFLSLVANKLSEYGMGGKATIQGDIFSYGIILLEMFTGKRPTDQMFIDDLNLHNFAKAALPEHVMQIIDPTLLPKEEHSEEIEEDANRTGGSSHWKNKLEDCISSIIEIALQCSMESQGERMNMNDVVRGLHLIKRKYS